MYRKASCTENALTQNKYRPTLCFSFWGVISSPDPLPGLCPWTPLGTVSETPWL